MVKGQDSFFHHKPGSTTVKTLANIRGKTFSQNNCGATIVAFPTASGQFSSASGPNGYGASEALTAHFDINISQHPM